MHSPSPVELRWPDEALLASFAAPLRCLSNAPLNGGFASARHWLLTQVGDEVAAAEAELVAAEAALGCGLDPHAVVGVPTTADVRAGVRRDHRPVTAVATAGADVALLVALDVPTSDAGLVTAVGWAADAAARGLAAARLRGVPAGDRDPGAAGVTLCVAAPAAGRRTPSRPSAAVAAALSLAVHGAVRSAARIHRRTLAMLGGD